MAKVLMIVSEAIPFAKTGGLADVIGSLPSALREEGAKVAVILPKYGGISPEYTREFRFITHFEITLGWRKQYCGIFQYTYHGIPFYFIDNEYYFSGSSIYSHYDGDVERFSFFDRAVMEAIPHLDFSPDVLHCHDWQTGMIPLLFDYQYRDRDPYKHMKIMFTIHNLQYQGVCSRELVSDYLGIPPYYFEQDKAGFYDQVNFMKAGIVFSHLITTVSKSYAEEIKHPFFGENLNTLIQEKSSKLHGVRNGIDSDRLNPATDPYLQKTYDVGSFQTGKASNKEALQKRLHLEVRADVPLIAIVSRLVVQKGLDLITRILNELLQEDVQLVVLGTGEALYEDSFRYFAEKYPHKMSANIAFSEELAQNIYAAADLFLMPSLFEPCGIGQMIASRYGAVAIVREVGGLKDTIHSYDSSHRQGNGFSFTNYNAHDMLYTIRRAIHYYHQPGIWPIIVKNAMHSDFSWKTSAQTYIGLYESIF